jgi:hypothetical protein
MGEFRADLAVESLVIVELKALQAVESAHERQLTNYLRATEFEVGLLFNFGPKAQFRRLIFDNDRKVARAAAATSQSHPCNPQNPCNPCHVLIFTRSY